MLFLRGAEEETCFGADQEQFQGVGFKSHLSGSSFLFRSTLRRTGFSVAMPFGIASPSDAQELGLWVNVVENTLLAVALLGRELSLSPAPLCGSFFSFGTPRARCRHAFV